jgi:uncharacterized phiE125 gp8 family phage protein
MDRYRRTTAKTAWPITLDEAKTQCFVAGTSDHDADLANLIQVATETVEKHTGRQIMPETWTLTLDGFPAEILLERPPVSAVSSIVYTDRAGESQTLSADYYQTDLSTQDGPARIMPAYGITWPNTIADTYGTVVVTFTVGYATASVVPLTVKHAIAFLVAHWFRNREPVVIGTNVANIPAGLDMLLSLSDWGGYA